MVGLRKRSIGATVWSGVDLFFQKGLNFLTTMVLARLLTPVDYGIIEMLAIFLGLSTAFIDSGFALSLIQREEISDLDISSIFYFNIFMGFLFFGVFWVTSPWIASFYRMPTLVPLARFVGAGLFFGSFGSVPKALFTKKLNFKRICIINAIGSLFACSIALWMAFNGFGVWSLAVQMVVLAAVSSVLFIWFCPRKPRLIFSIVSLRSLSRFGIFVLGSVLVDVIYSRLSTLIIGRQYSAKDLGNYARADQTQQFPANLVLMIIGRVAFPIFAAAQGDKGLVREGLSKALSMVMLITLPTMLGLTVTADRIITVLFGPQWTACVPYFKVLCLSGCLIPWQVLNNNVIAAQGNSNLFLRINVITKLVGIATLTVACFFGILAIAWSVVIAGGINAIITSYYIGKELRFGVLEQIREISPYFFGAGITAACIWFAGFIPIKPPLLVLSIQWVFGGIIYATYCHLLHLTAFVDTIQVTKDYLGRKNHSQALL